MRGPIWTLVERRLRRAIPPAKHAATIGDLAEDYARQRAQAGSLRGNLWLLKEARSLARAYRLSNSRTVHISTSPHQRARLMLFDDLRHAIRRLIARPAAALLAVALLAIAIGLATAMFSVVDSLLLRPVPFRSGDRLISQGLPSSPLVADVMELWRTSGIVERLGATAEERPLQLNGDSSTRWSVSSVTPELFDVLGVRPARGRLFAADALMDAEAMLLSESTWRSAFGADENILGRRVAIDGVTRTVIGIMPADFRFPKPSTAAWTPLQVARPLQPSIFTIVAALQPGVSADHAEARLRDISIQVIPMPSRRTGPPVRAISGTDITDVTRKALWLLFGGTALVFLVLSANVSSLLLTHLAARRREFGLCNALGASRTRLMRQAGLEHLLIGAAGVAGGIALAWFLTSAVPAVFVDRTLNPIDLDVRALVTAAMIGVAAVLLSGVLPAWLGTRSDPMDAITGSRHGGGETPATRAATRTLLVAEIALACALLVGSALLIRSFANLQHADRGLRLDGIVQARVTGLDDAFPSPEAMALGTMAVETQVRAWPEVIAVALSREIPPAGAAGTMRVTSPGTSEATEQLWVDRYRVTPAFFTMYGIPIVRGRMFQAGDTDKDVIIGEQLAARLLPGVDPLGQVLPISNANPPRVIGVAGEITLPTLDPSLDRPEYYVPLGNTSRTIYLSLRCRAACPSDAVMGERLSAINPAIAARFVAAPENEYQSHLHIPRATARVGGLFAFVALLTATAGLFSVLTKAVGRRRREFGIRTALGASPGDMCRLVFREALLIVGLGISAGALTGWLMSRALSAFQYGVTIADPASWIAVLGTIALAALMAAWRPAHQAMRANPVTLLREE